MENYGLIIWHLRTQAGLTVREAAKRINKSIGWLSEIENGSGTAKITEYEFDRVVSLLGGSEQKSMFKTWVAGYQKLESTDRTFDGAVLKYIRVKKKISITQAAKLTKLSFGYISKIETGVKPVTVEMRNRIMISYGYSPSSFKNLSTDPVRSRAVPIRLKLEILLNQIPKCLEELIFDFVRERISNQEVIPEGRTSKVSAAR